MVIIDISADTLTAPVYPGDPAPRVESLRSIHAGDDCNLSALYSCVHSGTHADAPLHFIDKGAAIDEIPLEAFIGPCRVVAVPDGIITAEYVDNHFSHRCERILVKGGGRAFFMDSSAEAVVALGVKLIGTDAQSLGYSGNQIKPHKAFLSAGVAVLEGLCLEDVEPGEYFLIAPPVKLAGLEGAPARALLIEDYIFWGTGHSL